MQCMVQSGVREAGKVAFRNLAPSSSGQGGLNPSNSGSGEAE